MSGALIKINEGTASNSSVVNLDGMTTDFDVYKLTVTNMKGNTSGEDVRMRFLVSGSQDSSSNYDRSLRLLRSANAFTQQGGYNATEFDLSTNLSSSGNGTFNADIYIFSPMNTSQFTSFLTQTSTLNSTPELISFVGGGILTVAQATNGVSMFMNSGNIAQGDFVLYALAK